MAGKWKFHECLYREKYFEAKRLSVNFSKLDFQWVPREQNEEADALSREAYESALKKFCE